MNTLSADATKRLLMIQWLAMLAAVGAYYGLTYLVTGVAPPRNPQMKTVLSTLEILAAVAFVSGIVLEGLLLARAANPQNVVTSGMVSAAFGESIAVFGLVWFFMSHERVWEFTAVSVLYFVRLFLKLPDFSARIDTLSR
ncbi:MAG TPA: hypothetical protein VGM51_04145 [Armatimonadota bacterium]|jgi:F0F1-type ATP synthase membrane subunit c/vacuolar-type H+-ATPase subunit K